MEITLGSQFESKMMINFIEQDGKKKSSSNVQGKVIKVMSRDVIIELDGQQRKITKPTYLNKNIYPVNHVVEKKTQEADAPKQSKKKGTPEKVSDEKETKADVPKTEAQMEPVEFPEGTNRTEQVRHYYNLGFTSPSKISKILGMGTSHCWKILTKLKNEK